MQQHLAASNARAFTSSSRESCWTLAGTRWVLARSFRSVCFARLSLLGERGGQVMHTERPTTTRSTCIPLGSPSCTDRSRRGWKIGVVPNSMQHDFSLKLHSMSDGCGHFSCHFGGLGAVTATPGPQGTQEGTREQKMNKKDVRGSAVGGHFG